LPSAVIATLSATSVKAEEVDGHHAGIGELDVGDPVGEQAGDDDSSIGLPRESWTRCRGRRRRSPS
jgi:hypothetical protein